MSEVGLNDPDVSFQGQQSLMLNEKNYKKFELTLAILIDIAVASLVAQHRL